MKLPEGFSSNLKSVLPYLLAAGAAGTAGAVLTPKQKEDRLRGEKESRSSYLKRVLKNAAITATLGGAGAFALHKGIPALTKGTGMALGGEGTSLPDAPSPSDELRSQVAKFTYEPGQPAYATAGAGAGIGALMGRKGAMKRLTENQGNLLDLLGRGVNSSDKVAPEMRKLLNTGDLKMYVQAAKQGIPSGVNPELLRKTLADAGRLEAFKIPSGTTATGLRRLADVSKTKLDTAGRMAKLVPKRYMALGALAPALLGYSTNNLVLDNIE